MSDNNSKATTNQVIEPNIDEVVFRVGGYITQQVDSGEAKFLVLTMWTKDKETGELIQLVNTLGNGQKIAAHVLAQPFIVPRQAVNTNNNGLILPTNKILH